MSNTKPDVSMGSALFICCYFELYIVYSTDLADELQAELVSRRAAARGAVLYLKLDLNNYVGW